MLKNPTEQQQAILAHDPTTHGRVLAGPGTGKSTTAVALAEHLMQLERPPRVRLLTFTRVATTELLGKRTLPLATIGISTVHSFALSVLLRNPGCASFPTPLRMPDEYESKQLIRPHLAERTGVSQRQLDRLVAEMAAKWESLDAEQNASIQPELRARFMGAWTEHRRVFGYTLLSELPDLLRRALRDHNDLQGVDYQLLIVDEYQDLNACDLEVLHRLADRGVAILAIGDDSQSIYSFRKAHPAGIRRFLDDYKTNRDYSLTHCHRSPRSIMEWAEYVITGDVDRADRAQLTFAPNAPQGTRALLAFDDDQREAEGLTQLVRWLNKVKEVPYSKILVLSRTDPNGNFTRLARSALKNDDVPIADPDEVRRLLSLPENRDLLSWLRLLINRTDSLAWWTLIHLHKGLGSTFVNHVFDEACSTGRSFGEVLQGAANNDFADFAPSIRRVATVLWQNVSARLNAVELDVREPQTGWGAVILREVDAGHLPPCTPQLRQLLSDLDELVEEPQDLGRYLSEIEPLGKDLVLKRSPGVRVMTMIGSKGMTVQATVVMGVDNDLIPRPGEDMAEERRLLYVAMSRSTEYLFLTWARRRYGPAAHSGNANTGRRQPSELLLGGPVESENGLTYIQTLR
jgi:DNA helicase-2/ATP-dependent DNA helicase PcrA